MATTYTPYLVQSGGLPTYYDYFIPFAYMTGGLPANNTVKIGQLIGSNVFAANQSTFTFTNIPAFNNYTLFWNVASNAAAFIESFYVYINGSNSANYNSSSMVATDGTATPSVHTAAAAFAIGSCTGTSSNAGSAGGGFVHISIPGGGSTAVPFGGIGGENGSTTSSNVQFQYGGGCYTAATALTSLEVITASGSMVTGSYVSLYGWS